MNKLAKVTAFLFKLLVVLSVPVLTIVISYPFRLKYRVITAGLAFLIIIFLFIIKKPKFEELKFKEIGIIFLISSYIDKLLMNLYSIKIEKVIKLIFKYTEMKLGYNTVHLAISFAIFFAICFYVYLFVTKIWPLIVDFFKNLSKGEKAFITITSIIASVICLLVVYNTKAFGATDLTFNYDVIYSADSSALVKGDAWFKIPNPENDIRQPLFGVFSFPFAVAAHFVADILFFVPKQFAYEYVMMVIQYVVLAATIILFARLIEEKEENRKYVYLLFGLSFPYLLFGLILEQYVLGLFYLALCIYAITKKKKYEEYAFIGATGSLATSGILILDNNWKDIKKTVVRILRIVLLAIIIAVLSGQFVIVFNLPKQINDLFRFTANHLPFGTRVDQYLYFVRSLFVAPHGRIIYDNLFTPLKFPSYQLPYISSVSKIGIIALVVMFISLIKNRKDKISILSFLWILFSFVILCVGGWGTYENGLILYSLYFSWAFYTLFYRLLKNKKWLLIPIVAFLVLNAIEIYHIINFAISYYAR